MGILTYNQIQNKERLYKPFIFAIISIILLIPALMLYYKNKINTYYLFYLIAPIFIILLNKLNNKIQYNKNIDRCLQFLGKYSLPIYVANIIALNSYYFIGIGHRALLTILLTLILGVLCVLYNKYTDKIIDKLS
jgi:peptidoglycan/LPS O-acetylase OafA/YrhL